VEVDASDNIAFDNSDGHDNISLINSFNPLAHAHNPGLTTYHLT